jgi:2,3-bisphosphoglycerate-dependent phosphoglycerate mutase
MARVDNLSCLNHGGWGANLHGKSSNLHTLVMIRHGESTWNVEKRFTGWCNVPLTEHGEADARDAGELMKLRGLKFDVAFTSGLERAWRTLAIALSSSGGSTTEVIKSWRLNERHYGALQGHLKDCPTLSNNFGSDKVLSYRRSWRMPPPKMDDPVTLEKLDADSVNLARMHLDERYFLRDDSGNEYVRDGYPRTESLMDCEDRVVSYWEDEIKPRIARGERVLIVAHANTIRGLIKTIDNIDDDVIHHLKIPNGVPIVYTLDNHLNPVVQTGKDDFLGFQANYLISPHNHKRMMAYETCTRKKLSSLFTFLDKNNDGTISSVDLMEGLMRLQNYKVSQAQIEGGGSVEEICEYEVEELLREIPEGELTLKDFLRTADNIEPGLTRLRLLV